MNTSDPYELGLDCVPGDRVRWETLGGRVYEGTLRSWDNLTAIVELDDGTTKAVRGA